MLKCIKQNICVTKFIIFLPNIMYLNIKLLLMSHISYLKTLCAGILLYRH